MGWLRQDSLPFDLKDIKEKFLNGEINENSLEQRMNLMKPVLEYKKGGLLIK